MGEVVPARTSPTLHPHCASIVATSTVNLNSLYKRPRQYDSSVWEGNYPQMYQTRNWTLKSMSLKSLKLNRKFVYEFMSDKGYCAVNEKKNVNSA